VSSPRRFEIASPAAILAILAPINFINYVELFANKFDVEIYGFGRAMQTATANNVTIITFGMGSAMAYTVMDRLLANAPKAVPFLRTAGRRSGRVFNQSERTSRFHPRGGSAGQESIRWNSGMEFGGPTDPEGDPRSVVDGTDTPLKPAAMNRCAWARDPK